MQHGDVYKDSIKILFVCLGNICRSPAAEGVARVLATSIHKPIVLDSAGTGAWHVGQPPHATMRRTAAANGYPIDDLRARQVRARDFSEFDWIVAMDQQNYSDLKELQSRYGGEARLCILLEGVSDAPLDVPDPYYGGADAFQESFDLIRRGVEEFFGRRLGG